MGMSQSAVSRIWRAFGLKPHLVESFKLSPDPQFIDKVRDVVGLYLNPPDAAVVLCVDEKTQIQALDRSAPVLPMPPGTPARATHDYVRNGTTNLYAALDVASGNVITSLTERHRAEEFRRFLDKIDKVVPSGLAVHVIVDNNATHKTPTIKRWLQRHPRFVLHFTPTYSAAGRPRPRHRSSRPSPGRRRECRPGATPPPAPTARGPGPGRTGCRAAGTPVPRDPR